MKVLVYGAGVIGTLFAARLHEAGNDVSLLARGERLASLQENGVQLAAGDSPIIEIVTVPVVESAADAYDLIVVQVRAHQMEAALESIAGVQGDVLFMLNWAAGPDYMAAAIGGERVLLGFPTEGGTMDGQVVRYRTSSVLARLVSMPIGEPDGRSTPRLERIVQSFRSAGINAKTEPRMDTWLKTHAAFELPLGRAVHTAGGPKLLARDPAAIRLMIQTMKHNLRSMPTPPVPRTFGALLILPEALLVPVFGRFLRSEAASPLSTDTPAVLAELDRLAEQVRAFSGRR
ncbi:MAG: Ketopantoate reductase [Microbacteriaceae bacterium]|nr:Ketopantoate reductase [Microbacteriaceae bacterium]